MSESVGRRGARRLVDVPVDVLEALHSGGVSANHVEQMAMDLRVLLGVVLPGARLGDHPIDSPRFLTRMRAAAAIAWETLGEELFEVAPSWSSDTARGWAAFAVPLTGLGTRDQLALERRFAADQHFAVREWAWLGVRPTVSADLRTSVSELQGWVRSDDVNVRRFAVEVTRPRGVWSAHIDALKQDPALGFPILDALVADRHRYVRDSVANWLNDASKTNPGWVIDQVRAWESRHGRDVLAYVSRRALRSVSRS